MNASTPVKPRVAVHKFSSCDGCQLGGAFVCRDGPVFNWGEVKALLAHRGF